jgi:hypothetical protein
VELPAWHPEVYPGSVILVPAPDGFFPRPLDLVSPEPATVDRHDTGDPLVVGPPGDRHYVWLIGDHPGHRPAVLLPLDADFDVRLEAARRFHRRLRRRPAGPPFPLLDLTAQRRGRLIQLLHALDFRLAGAGPRAVATALLDTTAMAVPAIEWKSSALRRKANRLIGDGLALMNGGYRDLLRGD